MLSVPCGTADGNTGRHTQSFTAEKLQRHTFGDPSKWRFKAKRVEAFVTLIANDHAIVVLGGAARFADLAMRAEPSKSQVLWRRLHWRVHTCRMGSPTAPNAVQHGTEITRVERPTDRTLQRRRVVPRTLSGDLEQGSVFVADGTQEFHQWDRADAEAGVVKKRVALQGR